jgi:hypothetical protein
MRHLSLLERLFPAAQYVHLVRDGRDAATSFLQMPAGTYTRTWAHPDTPAEFACLWRIEVTAARALGRRVGSERYLEVRYEDLVAEPDRVVRAICAFAELEFEPDMLDYAGSVDVAAKPHQQRLLQAPTQRVRDWRTEMAAEDARRFEEVAGDVLASSGYDVATNAGRPSLAARVRLLRYRVLLGAWNAAAATVQRSPLWRRRHPPL